VTSLIILLGSGRLNKAITFYRESTDTSNILRKLIDLYEAWNKPEKANEWRSKLAQIYRAGTETMQARPPAGYLMKGFF